MSQAFHYHCIQLTIKLKVIEDKFKRVRKKWLKRKERVENKSPRKRGAQKEKKSPSQKALLNPAPARGPKVIRHGSLGKIPDGGHITDGKVVATTMPGTN